MSFASTFAQPAMRVGGSILRGTSLPIMGRTLGIVVGAGLMAAIYQLVSDESKATINAFRIRGQYRRQRHENILMITLGSALPADLQDTLLRSRDAFQQSMKILANPNIAVENRDLLRAAIFRVCNPSA